VGADGWAPHAAPGAHAMIAPEPTTTTTPSPAPTSTPTPTAKAAATTASRRPCNIVPHPLTPRTITIPGITRRAGIVTPPRLPGRVPGAPPLTTVGKELFAWDSKSGIRPGGRHGKVRLNAHVWPDGSAVGNRLLASLHRGDRIVVRGKTLKLCYRVTDRVQVLASRGLPRFYDRIGRPRLAIVVCSGRRLGPGVWERRTVWFAKAKA
ncbi:MAG: class F sortase, partial [Actinomycetes bacterium]